MEFRGTLFNACVIIQLLKVHCFGHFFGGAGSFPCTIKLTAEFLEVGLARFMSNVVLSLITAGTFAITHR